MKLKKKRKERIIVNLYEIMSYAHSTNFTLSPLSLNKNFIEKILTVGHIHVIP